MAKNKSLTILGINFGHDASLTLFQDGKLVSYRELERSTRIKHQHGIEEASVVQFLEECDLGVHDIDCIGLSATQAWGGLTDSIGAEWGYDADLYPCQAYPAWHKEPRMFSSRNFGGFYASHIARFPQQHHLKFPDAIGSWSAFPHGSPSNPSHINGMVNTFNTMHLTMTASPEHRIGLYSQFISPFRVTIAGITRPGFFVQHHICHAWYAAYYLPARSFIVSHDGGAPDFPFNSGGVFFADTQYVVPVCGHNLGLGYLYDRATLSAGFDISGTGKLMGLAAYGHPAEGIETIIEQLRTLSTAPTLLTMTAVDQVVKDLIQLAIHHGLRRVRAGAPFTFAFANKNFSISLAANVQYLVEALYPQEIGKLLAVLIENTLVPSLVGLVGGFTLNCPSNTLLQLRVPMARIEGLPGATDSGISIGAAAALHGFLTGEVARHQTKEPAGAAFPPNIIAAKDVAYTIPLPRIDLPGPLALWLAKQLLDGKLVCYFTGGAEIGPRALGHRSIIAHATTTAIRDRINTNKGREAWRPLAPMVRAIDFSRYFFGSPDNAEYMLFTFPVLSKEIPGVTHADGTARVQVLRPQSGLLYDVLTALQELHAVPVIINTSFNVAGEPIVDTREHAVRSFLQLGFDFLVVEGEVYQPTASAPPHH